MKTYLEELKGHVRGNARLRRKADRLRARIESLELGVWWCIASLDAKGLGDIPEVARLAAKVGWRRSSPRDRK